MRPYQPDRSRTKVCQDGGTSFLDLQKTITKAVLLQIEAILGIQPASDLSQRIPMALAARNLPGIWIYDVLKLNTPNPGYLILTPKIPISTSKPYGRLLPRSELLLGREPVLPGQGSVRSGDWR